MASSTRRFNRLLLASKRTTEIVAGLVTSVFGRTGAVVAANGDYTASQVTNVPAGNIAGATVQAAINELDTEKLPTASYTAADVLAKILTVDGSGSGLDADLLDGFSSGAFAAAAFLHRGSAERSTEVMQAWGSESWSLPS